MNIPDDQLFDPYADTLPRLPVKRRDLQDDTTTSRDESTNTSEARQVTKKPSKLKKYNPSY